MADKFTDLWDLSTPPKPSASKTLGFALQQTNYNTRKPQQDVFALLSGTSQGSSAPNSRPITPSSIGQGATSKVSVSKTSGDAFSGLFTESLGRGSQNNTNLTIAERAALAEKAKREQSNKQPPIPVKKEVSAWDGLDTLANPLSTKIPVKSVAEDDWFVQSKPVSNANIVVDESPVDDWGLVDFGSKPTHGPISQAVPSQTILDMDDLPFPIAHPQPARPVIIEPVQHFDSLGDFDFGNREDVDADSQDGDDILGVLSKPIDTLSKRSTPSATSNRATPSPQPSTSRPESRSISPPPHVLGQIVEMGFSIEQARIALASTDTGLDVHAALETLLSNGAVSETPDSRNRQTDETVPYRRPSRPNSSARTARERINRSTPSPAGSQQDKNTQADKILAQASEIGLNVFSRANAFWNQGKEMVQKAYEERARPTGYSGSSHPGRPRWMQDDLPRSGSQAEEFSGKRDGGYSDNFSPTEPKEVTISKSEPRSQPRKQTKTEDLFSHEHAVYVPPSRRSRRPQPETSVNQAPVPSSSSALPLRASSPVRLIQRQTVVASPSVIASSAKHKSIGAEKFKLGQYAEAEAAYTAAIAVLPESHLLLVPLYNNRALTRLKTGDHTGAIEDCNTVITIIGPSYNPKTEAKVEKEDEGAGVQLADALVKAWKRRAEAYEGKEKWAAAQSDWEAITAVDWVGERLRREAIQSVGRCRRMTNDRPSISSAPASTKSVTSKTATVRPPNRAGPTPPSEAQMKLREAHKAAEAEDQARHELKDTVDAQLLTWKGGKEANIRALIASLDTILWPELGWQKVGMAELVTPAQVKVRYTKAIAKLHPDKLSARNLTLEQRMIANGVFGALNEAWNNFKH